jgi:hypothetical protein
MPKQVEETTGHKIANGLGVATAFLGMLAVLIFVIKWLWNHL